MEIKSGTEKAPEKLPADGKRRIFKSVEQKDGVSQRKLASKFKVSQPYISKVFKRAFVRYRKK